MGQRASGSTYGIQGDKQEIQNGIIRALNQGKVLSVEAGSGAEPQQCEQYSGVLVKAEPSNSKAEWVTERDGGALVPPLGQVIFSLCLQH